MQIDECSTLECFSIAPSACSLSYKHTGVVCCIGIGRAGDRAADSVAGLLPGSIPRGAAKIGILGVGGLIAFSVLQKVYFWDIALTA